MKKYILVILLHSIFGCSLCNAQWKITPTLASRSIRYHGGFSSNGSVPPRFLNYGLYFEKNNSGNKPGLVAKLSIGTKEHSMMYFSAPVYGVYLNGPSYNISRTQKLTLRYCETAIMAKMDIYKHFNINLGPYLTFNMRNIINPKDTYSVSINPPFSQSTAKELHTVLEIGGALRINYQTKIVEGLYLQIHFMNTRSFNDLRKNHWRDVQVLVRDEQTQELHWESAKSSRLSSRTYELGIGLGYYL
jgi:hypothetical protein